MTALRDQLARETEMSAEAVEAMERRLLEAFAAHHAAPDETGDRPLAPVAARGYRWREWVAAAAAIVIVAGVTAWRGLGGSGPTTSPMPPAVTPSRPALSSAASSSAVPSPAVAPSALPSSARAMAGARSRPVIEAVTNRAAPPASASAARRNPGAARLGGFVALPGAAGLPQFESGTIVRIGLPVASLPGYGVDISRAADAGAVEADVLVGQDGQARAIRLVSSQYSSSRSGQ